MGLERDIDRALFLAGRQGDKNKVQTITRLRDLLLTEIQAGFVDPLKPSEIGQAPSLAARLQDVLQYVDDETTLRQLYYYRDSESPPDWAELMKSLKPEERKAIRGTFGRIYWNNLRNPVKVKEIRETPLEDLLQWRGVGSGGAIFLSIAFYRPQPEETLSA